jgi:hypothetical protein
VVPSRPATDVAARERWFVKKLLLVGGCLAVAMAAVKLGSLFTRPPSPSWWWPLVGVGFAGACVGGLVWAPSRRLFRRNLALPLLLCVLLAMPDHIGTLRWLADVEALAAGAVIVVGAVAILAGLDLLGPSLRSAFAVVRPRPRLARGRPRRARGKRQ